MLIIGKSMYVCVCRAGRVGGENGRTREIHGKSLYLSPNFAPNLKLTLKK